MTNYSPIGGSHPITGVTGKTPTSVNIPNSSTQIVPANVNRRFLVLTNVGNKDIFMAVGNTAVVDNGFLLAKGTQTLIGLVSEPITEQINGITDGATSDILIQEFE